MLKEQALYLRIYFDPICTEVARIVGSQGFTYREMEGKREPLYKRFDKVAVQSAVYHLAIFEGQMTCNPKPLAQVKLRAEARTLCWQLLGPAPEHPWFDLWKKPERLPLPWDSEPQAADEPKKRARKKAR